MSLTYDTRAAALFHPEQDSAELPLEEGQQPSELALAAECARLAYLRIEEPTGAQTKRLNQALARFGFGPAERFGHSNTGSQGYGTYRPADRCAVIAVRGTQTDEWQDAFSDVGIRPMPPAHGSNGRVHNGFLQSSIGLLPDMRTWLADLPQPLARRVVCGHSLGAAVATLLAEPLAAHRLVTLGSPRVADAAYRQRLSGLHHLDITRIVDGCDVVTMVPPGEMVVPDFIFNMLEGVLSGALAGLEWLPARLRELSGRALPYCHLGRKIYIDRDGRLHPEPAADFITSDRWRAILTWPTLGVEHVPTRLLSDHAPINYLRALWPLAP